MPVRHSSGALLLFLTLTPALLMGALAWSAGPLGRPRLGSL